MDTLFEGRTKQVNQLNAEIKADNDLTPEEEKELRANMTPLTLTPEQVRKDNEDAAKTPEDQMNKSPTEEAPSKSSNTAPSTPGSSSSGGVAVPGQADPNMIVFPGRKKK